MKTTVLFVVVMFVLFPGTNALYSQSNADTKELTI